jgi:2,3-bisphosphoglycerate-independent phosphoglycerate mutase
MSAPVVLCILDGWGDAPDAPDNAITRAQTPHWDRVCATYPRGQLDASEQYVGLPSGQMGNSEVGHMHIGAGRVLLQDLPRIDAAIAEGSLSGLLPLKQHIAALKQSGGTCHLMGLLSDGGVHAHMRHMLALARDITAEGVPVAIHAFLDGRDTPPKSAETYMAACEAALPDGARIATVSGRYYAMDRDKRWERVAKAYHAMVSADAARFASAEAAIAASYAEGVTDEFVVPCVVGEYAGMRDGDAVLMANFRADRAREILQALGEVDFTGFVRSRYVQTAHKLGMVPYSKDLFPLYDALFPPEEIRDSLGEVVAQAGRSQLRIAETEKYAHVTFFFNGGREEPFAGEHRILVPSPDVATYDLKPEMSAAEVTDALIAALPEHDLIVVNFANTDMVGHTGDFDATVQAIEAVDACLGRIEAALQPLGGRMLITADHGNAEDMHNDLTGQAHTAHSCNPVPLLLVDARFANTALSLGRGSLVDIAPTILDLMGIAPPRVMTGMSRIPKPPHTETGAA